MKAIDLITRAAVAVGVLGKGETMPAPDAADALNLLNDMLDSWSLSRLYVYQLYEETFPMVIGKSVYTIGVGGDFNTVRPTEIESAYLRINNLDYPIEMIDNDAYSAITLKSTVSGVPQYLYYDPQTPLGEINIWPSPAQACTLYLQTPKQLQQFPNLSTDVTFPPGYAEAIRYALAVRLCADYAIAPTPALMDITKSSIERLQIQNSTVPVLKTGMSHSGRFNINRGY